MTGPDDRHRNPPSTSRGPQWARLAALLVLLALATLRFQGLDFGHPSPNSRPDEEHVIGEALALNSGDDQVGFFRYPPGYARLQSWWLGLTLDQADLEAWYRDPMTIQRRARLLGALFGIAAVLAAGLIARQLFASEFAGWAAALVLALTPLHLRDSHFATLEAPGAALSTLAIWAGLGRPRCLYRWDLVAGLLAGMAAAIKYPFGAILVGLLLARVLRAENRIRGSALLVGAALIGFLALAPEAIWATDGILEGIRSEAEVQKTQTATIELTTRLSVYLAGLASGVGIAALGLAFLGLCRLLGRPRLLLPASGLLVLAVTHLSFGNLFLRYLIPGLPFLAALAGGGAVEIQRRLARISPLVVAVLLVAMLPALLRCIAIVDGFRAADTRGQLLEAFQDGELDPDLPIVSPAYPFRPVPEAFDQRLLEAISKRSGESRAELQAEASRAALAQEPVARRLEIYPLTPRSLNGTLQALVGRDYYFVLPTHFSARYAWHAERRDQIIEFAPKMGAQVSLVARFSPWRQEGMPDASHYDERDYGWLQPFPHAEIVERIGPLIEVYLVDIPPFRTPER